jgi:hypothetical protein
LTFDLITWSHLLNGLRVDFNDGDLTAMVGAGNQSPVGIPRERMNIAGLVLFYRENMAMLCNFPGLRRDDSQLSMHASNSNPLPARRPRYRFCWKISFETTHDLTRVCIPYLDFAII